MSDSASLLTDRVGAVFLATHEMWLNKYDFTSFNCRKCAGVLPFKKKDKNIQTNQ